MNLEDLKKRATAAELALIDTLIKIHDQAEVSRFMRIMEQSIIGETDVFADRRQAEAVKRAVKHAMEEFQRTKP